MLSLWGLLKVILLVTNAVAILNRKRFLKRFESDVPDLSLRHQILNFLLAAQYLRAPLIPVNILGCVIESRCREQRGFSCRALRVLVAAVAARPVVDGLHNQVLLEYTVLPVEVLDLKTSLLIPPLLAITYVVIGGLLPAESRRIVGDGVVRDVALGDRARAIVAVLSTAAIIRLSVFAATLPQATALGLLVAAALAQWLALDASIASLALALVVAVAGPVAEIPFMTAGCWHYLAPDYFPAGPVGLSSLTGPCYFAVTTDAIALARWFGVKDPRRTS
ncbi:hypothetical protein CTAYLR_004049 [Chrysophaeum taylorii]|uniref:Uncharacterized protein n=1 Tax=Chrysophaeum taylorii TaxID=2483200 RepID=A0AAD7UPC4_9STRA|nr:hypothetical protein CTAYLR_004049 [Chrysophaeum taylorii]